MTAAERVVELCNKKGIRISKLERDCGFANGYIKGLKSGKIPAERVKIIADYLEVTYDKIDPEVFSVNEQYYINVETAKLAQELHDNPNMRLLFDAARNARPEDLQMAAQILLRFKETSGE